MRNKGWFREAEVKGKVKVGVRGNEICLVSMLFVFCVLFLGGDGWGFVGSSWGCCM